MICLKGFVSNSRKEHIFSKFCISLFSAAGLGLGITEAAGMACAACSKWVCLLGKVLWATLSPSKFSSRVYQSCQFSPKVFLLLWCDRMLENPCMNIRR